MAVVRASLLRAELAGYEATVGPLGAGHLKGRAIGNKGRGVSHREDDAENVSVGRWRRFAKTRSAVRLFRCTSERDRG